MQYKWLNYFTPCLLLCYFFIIGLVYCIFATPEFGGWGPIVIVVCALISMISFVADIFIKIFLKDRTGWVFLTEALLIVAICFWLNY
jgi:MFS superfamily sulfate permease-like transporter